jgi:hypothetical protein
VARPHPQDPQAWAPVPQPGYAASAPSTAPHQPFAPAPQGGKGLAIAAIVLSALALLGVLAMAAFFFLGPFAGGSHYVLYGEVGATSGTVSDAVLRDAITAALEDEGSTADELTCPAESKVGQGLVTVCHGSVDGFDWTGIVVFEDADGTFVVTEY